MWKAIRASSSVRSRSAAHALRSAATRDEWRVKVCLAFSRLASYLPRFKMSAMVREVGLFWVA